MEKNWKIQVSNWTKIPTNTANAVLEECKDYLSYTITEADKITARAFTFTLLSISAIGALIGVTINELNSEKANECFICLNIATVVSISILTILFVIILFPRLVMAKGRRPEEIAKEEILCPDNLKEEQIHLSFIINEIENCKSKIDYNFNSNAKRINKLKIGIILSCILFFVYFVLMLIVKL